MSLRNCEKKSEFQPMITYNKPTVVYGLFQYNNQSEVIVQNARNLSLQIHQVAVSAIAWKEALKCVCM